MQVRHGSSRPAALAILLALLLAAATLAGCGQHQERLDGTAAADSGTASPQAEAAGDSAGAAMVDSTAGGAVDSAAAASQKGKGGFLGGIFRSRKKADEVKEEPVPVELDLAQVRDMPAYLATTATLQPDKQADVLAKINGEVRRILVEEGDWVREGQVLAELDGAAQRVALEEADARYRALELDLERSRALAAQQLASEKDLNDTQYRFEEAQAQRKACQLQVEYTRITAPFAGQIVARAVDPGQTVATGAKIFTIVDREPLLAEIHVPEREAAKITAGQSVVISPDANLGQSTRGTVLRVAPVVDARTGTVKVTCQVSDVSTTLRPGSFVRVQVQTDLRAHVLTIPKRAVVAEGGETYVFKAVADSVLKVPVTTGLTNHALVEITAGLAEGERIVTIGHGALKSGSKIREVGSEKSAMADSSPGQSVSR